MYSYREKEHDALCCEPVRIRAIIHKADPSHTGKQNGLQISLTNQKLARQKKGLYKEKNHTVHSKLYFI